MANKAMIMPITIPTMDAEDSSGGSWRLKISGLSSGDKQVGGVGGDHVPNSVHVRTVGELGSSLVPGTQ